jgi:hypothetical protein
MTSPVLARTVSGDRGRAVRRLAVSAPAPTSSDYPLCHYDDGNLALVYIEVPWGRIGWCRKHLVNVGDWPARFFEESE